MADVVPMGKDLSTGQARPVTSADDVSDADGTGISVLPTRYVEGLKVDYASAATCTVEAGSCRDVDDADNMVLSSTVTPSMATLGAIQGIARATLTGTVQTFSSSTTVTGSGTAFLTEFGTRALTGRIGTAGSATVNGDSGSKFLTEIAVGDLIGIPTLSARKFVTVTAIASDISMTVDETIVIPGFWSSAGEVIENPVITDANGVARLVRTISSDTALITTAAFPGAAGPGTGYAGGEVASAWYAVWLVKGSTGVGAMFSTTRTTLVGPPSGYDDSSRRIGWMKNDSSSDFMVLNSKEMGGARYYSYNHVRADVVLMSSGTATSWTWINCSSLVPPTARLLDVTAMLTSDGANRPVYFREDAGGAATVDRGNWVYQKLSLETATIHAIQPLDPQQRFQYATQSGDGTGVWANGFIDTL